MLTVSESPRDVVAYYWNAYFEWRSQYGLQDDCMRELVAAMRAEMDSQVVTGESAARLKKLAFMIEAEIVGKQEGHNRKVA